MKNKQHRISKKEFLQAINNAETGWGLIGTLQAILDFTDEDIEKAIHDLIWREVSK